MKQIPDRIQAEFKVVLDQKHVPPTQQGHYLKWLRYYTDPILVFTTKNADPKSPGRNFPKN